MSQVKLLNWFQIANAPNGPGIYAWYAKIFISNADLELFERNMFAAKSAGESEEAVVKDALERFVFAPFHETDYTVDVSGQLKPNYSGTLKHSPSVSRSLIDRLLQEPQRLREIAKLLESVVPHFTAPLYIGMARNLNDRLSKHKALIEQFNEGRSDAARDIESGFARQVVNRRLPPTKLQVAIAEVQTIAAEPQDLENILNRINFPIFGRN
jgi:hypothetical protein